MAGGEAMAELEAELEAHRAHPGIVVGAREGEGLHRGAAGRSPPRGAQPGTNPLGPGAKPQAAGGLI